MPTRRLALALITSSLYFRSAHGLRAQDDDPLREGCPTNHVEDGRIDVIHLSVTFLLGLRLGRSWMVYWGNGIGELLGDSTPGDGREVEPRFGGHTGLGVIRALGRRFFLDASLTGIIFKNFERGEAPEPRDRMPERAYSGSSTRASGSW